MRKLLRKETEKKSSALRILGASFFGLIFNSFSFLILDYSVPKILMRVKGISYTDALLLYSDSFFSSFVLGCFVIFVSAAIAGFLAKKYGIIAGLLANSKYILFLGLAILFVLFRGANIFSVLASHAFIKLLMFILVAILGGLFGQKMYNRDRDLDLDKDGFTIFGVCWYHYFWIIPLIMYPFISSIVVVAYSWNYTFTTSILFLSNPVLWINISWLFYFFVNPLIIILISLLLVFSFFKFWKVMQSGQSYYAGYEKLFQIFMYGFVAPIAVKMVANFTIKATENMYSPVINDWKVGMGYLLVIPVAAVIISFILWIKKFISGKPEKKKKFKK
jgi:hypothetical protein